MSDGAPSATEGDASEEDAAERDQQVLRLGAAGCGRAEIAAALGMCPEAPAQREAEDAALATALRGASGLAQAWWEAQAREACEAGRFSFAAWTREMRRRFDETGSRSDNAIGAPKTGRAKWAERPRATYLLPCNGRTKLNPDGTCPCGAYHDEDFWRAEDDAWRAESPENAACPSWDELRNQDYSNGEDDEIDAGDEIHTGEIDDDEQL